MKYIRVIISIIIIVVAGYIIIGQFSFPANVPDVGGFCEELDGDSWYIVNADGSRESFVLPGRADSDIVLETTLPDDVGREKSALCFRGMGLQVYIDGKLRTDYSVDDYRLLGDRSAECFVMVPIYPEDSGKQLLVNYAYTSGFVYQVYVGNRIGILKYLFSRYGTEIFVGLAVLILGGICYLAAVGYQLIYKKYLELRDLSLGVIFGGVWVMSNSIFRQLYTRNVSVMSDTPFLMVIIMPLPFLVFINSLQKGRHQKAIMTAEIIEIANFVIVGTFFVIGKMTLLQSFPIAAGCALISIIIISYTMIYDVIKKKASSYRYVAFGFAFLGVAAACQILMFQFQHNGVFSGLFMAIGLLVFIGCAMIHTIKQLISVRIEANNARETSKVKDQFLANMSHEIRTPLNGILGMNEMILRDTKEDGIKKYAVNIKGAGQTLLSLINDILDLSKIEAGSMQLVPIEYELASVLNDVINMTRSRALEKGLEYKFEVSEKLPAVFYGDEIRVRQVMLNIINNAIKYTQEGFVHVRVTAKDEHDGEKLSLYLKVADSGIGIKSEDKEKLFKSFQRLDEKKNQKIEGTGLGLHITDLLVKMMGGHIDVKSEYGKGSTFRVYMPQIPVSSDEIGDFSKAVEDFVDNMELEETTLYAPKATVLIVDDNEMNLDVMEGLLRDTKVQLDLVASGFDCIKKMRYKKYDIVMLDQMMPKLSGEETLHKLLEEDLIGQTPIIALTADAIVGARENYISMGFTDYLSKPVKYEELENLLKAYIPKDKQQKKEEVSLDLPILLLWGNDSARLREEKEKLERSYKCVCVVGSNAMEKYLQKHEPYAVMHII